MASTYTDLGIELMTTGENAGTWGTKTNNNLTLIEQLTGGVLSLSIAGVAGTQALDITDGDLAGTAQQRVIEFTGSITGNRIITFPVLTENFYIIKNGTSGAYTVQLKAATGSGATVTFSATDKGYKIIYLDGVATNTGVFDTEFVTPTATQTLTNKTLTSPIISSISNTGTITLPTATDTLVGRATTDTLTNKTLTSPVFSGTATNFKSTGIDDNATSTAITINSSENVGIGTASPSQALDVVGSIEVSDGIYIGDTATVTGAFEALGTIKLDGNYPTGSNNVALGDGALDDGSLSGGVNTAIGSAALTANTTGSANTALGFGSLDANTTGGSNTAVGRESLKVNTTGSFNTAIGIKQVLT